MKKFAKILCTVMAFGMACSVVGCKDSDKDKDGGKTPLTQEGAFTAATTAAKNFTYNGAYTAEVSEKSSNSYLSESSDPEATAVTRTHASETSYKATYNPATREGAISNSYSSSHSNGTDTPDEYSGSGAGKVVKDGDYYYMYSIEEAEEAGAEADVYAEKYSAANYAANDIFVEEYSISEILSNVQIAWLNAPNAAAVLNGFNDIYKNDANKSFNVTFAEAEDGTISLTVKYSGTLSKTVEDLTYTMTEAQEVSVSVKDSKLATLSLKSSSSVKEGETVMESEEEECSYKFTYAFDTALFDGVDLTNAPEKDAIEEDTSSYRSIEYVYCVGDYTGSSDDDYDGSKGIDASKTTAEQVAEFKSRFNAQEDGYYGEIVGYYTDKAMTKELTDTISDADWAAVEKVYVKCATQSDSAYIQMTMIFDCNPDWAWIMGDMDNMVQMMAYPASAGSFAHAMATEQFGKLGTITVSVGGTVTEEATMAITGGSFYKVEYKLTITDASNMILMYI